MSAENTLDALVARVQALIDFGEGGTVVYPDPTNEGLFVLEGSSPSKLVGFDPAQGKLPTSVEQRLNSTYVLKGEIGGGIFLDTDGTPYFDTTASGGGSIALDADGVPYVTGV